MKPGPNLKQRSRGRNNNGGGKKHMPSRNQTYDSNGPDIRIRGNAHQVLEKYLTMARDCTLQGDRVAAENYYQHAEHYFRVINSQNQANGRPNDRPMTTPADDQMSMAGGFDGDDGEDQHDDGAEEGTHESGQQDTHQDSQDTASHNTASPDSASRGSPHGGQQEREEEVAPVVEAEPRRARSEQSPEPVVEPAPVVVRRRREPRAATPPPEQNGAEAEPKRARSGQPAEA
jgi:hypothetical protein